MLSVSFISFVRRHASVAFGSVRYNSGVGVGIYRPTVVCIQGTVLITGIQCINMLYIVH